MQMKTISEDLLKTPQTQACSALVRAVEQFLAETHASGDGGSSYTSMVQTLKSPRKSNVFGIFGERGASKSTVLIHTFLKLDELASAEPGRRRRLCIVPPFDGSLMVDGVPPGLVLLDWLLDNLRSQQPNGPPDQTRLSDEMAYAWLQGEPQTQRLARDLATTPGHFARLAREASLKRLSLPRLVFDWLESEATARGIDAFVIGLDDADLIRGDGERLLLRSLLDELHQKRLIIFLAADIRRFETEVQSTRQHDDPMTSERMARDLIYKVLPRRNRVQLSGFNREDRKSFKISTNSMTADLNAMLDKVNKLARERELDPLVFALHGLRGLLPHLPRGLENIFHELDVLEGWTARHEPNKSGSSNHETISALISLLTTFAEARGEYDLANTLAVRDLGEWVSAFRWSAEEGTELDFDALATRAATEHEALLEFTPTQGADERELRTIGVSRARWAELLTNVALAREDLKVDLLLERYAQLRARYEQARLDWATDADAASAALREADASFLAEQMWCAWRLDALEPRLRARRLGRGDQMSDLKVQIGWRHAYDALRGRRPIWPDALLSHLLFDRADFVERLPAARARDYGLDWQRGRENAPLLPHSVRALVLLGDGLASGPWQTLSRSPRFESVGERVRLAAGLVRAAWLHALRALAWGRGWLAKGAPLQVPEQDLPFLKALRASGVSELERGTLLSWGEARLFTSFERFADLPAKEALEQQMLDGFTADAREAARGDLIWRQLLDGLDSYTRSPAFADLNLR